MHMYLAGSDKSIPNYKFVSHENTCFLFRGKTPHILTNFFYIETKLKASSARTNRNFFS